MSRLEEPPMKSQPQRALARWARSPSEKLLNVALAALVGVALVWLGYQFWRLLFQPSPAGAVDLLLRHGECQEWFRGVPIYDTRVDAVYPPASYLMLWPLLGWLSPGAMRIFWVLPTVLSIAWLCCLAVRYGGVADARYRRLLWVLPLATYPVGATVGNGQLSILVVATLFAGTAMLARSARSWGRDLWSAGLILLALIKPSVAAYFFWIPLFVPGGLRVACLVLAGYVLLTVGAALAQDQGVYELMEAWLRRAASGIEWGSSQGGGAITKGALRITGINLQSVLSVLGERGLIGVLAPVPIVLLGAWVLWRRAADMGRLLGVTAIVARFASYHGWYDDVLLLLPLVALIRESHAGACPRERAFATWLALAGTLFLLAPGGTYSLPQGLANLYAIAQAGCWVTVLVFLVRTTRSPNHPARAVASAPRAAYDQSR